VATEVRGIDLGPSTDLPTQASPRAELAYPDLPFSDKPPDDLLSLEILRSALKMVLKLCVSRCVIDEIMKHQTWKMG